MCVPVFMEHKIQFQTQVIDRDRHDLVAQEVVEKLKLLAPLLIEERLLQMKLEDLRAKIKELRQ